MFFFNPGFIDKNPHRLSHSSYEVSYLEFRQKDEYPFGEGVK